MYIKVPRIWDRIPLFSLCEFINLKYLTDIFSVTLKQEMEKNKKELKQIRHDSNQKSNKITELRQQVTMTTQNNRSLESDNKRLSDDLKHRDEEIEELRTRLGCLQDAITSPSGDPRSSALNRLITEYPGM